jgi:hypothetical protein
VSPFISRMFPWNTDMPDDLGKSSSFRRSRARPSSGLPARAVRYAAILSVD